MFPWLVGGWILKQKGQPSFPIVLKHRGDLGVSADADRVISAAGVRMPITLTVAVLKSMR
jgi:hypothetical protein